MYLSRNSTTSALEEKKASSPSLGLAHWVSMRASTALTAINIQHSKHRKSNVTVIQQIRRCVILKKKYKITNQWSIPHYDLKIWSSLLVHFCVAILQWRILLGLVSLVPQVHIPENINGLMDKYYKKHCPYTTHFLTFPDVSETNHDSLLYKT